MTTNELLLNSISAFLKGEVLTAPEDTDWQELIQKAEQQKLLPMVYEVLGGSMPENVKKPCKAAAIGEIVSQTQRTAEFLKTYKELSEAGISPLVVKGIICRSVYDKPDYRASSDEDLYIPLDDYPVFHKKMLELGFDSKEPDYKNAHEERYFSNGILIEGHWELFPQENVALNALNVFAEVFWNRAKMQLVDEIEIKALEPTDHMIFLLLHAYKHFVASGVGIRQICDIVQWSKHYKLDWQRINEVMKKINGECFAAAIFDAGEKHFGMEYPENWERADSTALLGDALDGGVYGTSSMDRKHSASMTLEAVEASGRGKGGAPYIKTLFPNRAVMEMSYPWVKKSAALMPAAWVARIIRYLGSEANKNSVAESLKVGNERMELLRKYKII